MATAADIIRDALKLLGVLAAGESLSAVDQVDGLRALNRMLGTWANERLLVHGTRRATYTLTAGLSPHTIGATGTLATTRPLRIDGAGIVESEQERPLRLLTDAEYQRIPDKGLDGTPSQVWVEQTHPNAKLWLWPVPTTAATLALYTWSRITEFEASDAVSLPDGYEDALIHALAIRVAPLYGVEPGGTLRENASEALAAVKRTNMQTPLVEMDSALTRRGGGSDVDIVGIAESPGGLY